jgi:hypothetical protein
MSAAGPRWRALRRDSDSFGGWSGLDGRVIRYRGRDDVERAIAFTPDDQQYFEDVCGYNRGPSRTAPPFVKDLRLAAEVTFLGGDGALRWELTAGGRVFAATIAPRGAVMLSMAPAGAPEQYQVLGGMLLPGFRTGRPVRVELVHVDFRVSLAIDGREVLASTDDNYAPDVDALRAGPEASRAGLKIVARFLDVDVRRLRIDRDVYYTYRPRVTQRAYAGSPFVLADGEYFVLGDNSGDSRDSREWTERGPHVPASYRVGTVPANQIVGSAAFVYLPGLLPLDTAGRWRIPDVGRIRFVR